MFDPQTIPVLVWHCIPRAEKLAIFAFISDAQNSIPFTLVSLIELTFSLHAGSMAEVRLAAFEEAYILARTEIEIEEVTVTVYLHDQAWIENCRACFVAGDCTGGGSSSWATRDCFTLNPPF